MHLIPSHKPPIPPMRNGSNPYFEEVPTKSLMGHMTTSKKPREAPDGVSDTDKKLYAKIRKWTKRLDGQFRPCGLKIGMSSFIGFIPGAGPVIDLLMVLHIYHLAKRMDGGLKGSLRSKWIANITADFLIRFLIPELGDIIDIFLSANTRNLLLLDEHLRTEVAKRAELRRERALPESAPSSGDAVAKPTWKAQLPSLAGKKPNHQDQSVSDHHNVADNGSQHQNHHYQSRHHQQSQPQPQHSGEYPSQSRDNNVRDTMYAMVNSHAMDPQPTSGSMPKPRDPYSQPTGTGYHHGTHQHGPSPAREQRRPSHHGHHYHDHHGNPLPPRSVRDGSDASAIMYRRHKRYPIDPADPKELIDEPLSYHGFKA